MRFPTLIFWLALCCGLTNGCSEGVTKRTAATVLYVKGDVVFGMAEGNKSQPVTRESRLPEGSAVRTSDGGLLNLGLIGGAIAQMSSNSEIKIEELEISKDGNQTRGGIRSRSARIRLSRGKITVLFSGSHQLVPSQLPRRKMPRRKSIFLIRSKLKISCASWVPVGGIGARFSECFG